MSVQGKAVNKTSGALLTTGNITIRVYDNLTNGNLVFNDTFNNTISNGTFNVLLGSQLPLNLTYNKMYFMELGINTETVIGNTNRRQFFATGGPNQTYLAVSEDSGGNVGIGTLSPAARLEVTGSANVLALNVNNSLYVNTTTSYVGIGTSIPNALLHVAGNIISTGTLFGQLAASNLTGISSLNYGILVSQANITGITIPANNVTNGTFANNPYVFQNLVTLQGFNATTGLFSGNLGIGTASPLQKLHVVGSAYINATGDATATLTFNSSDIMLGGTGWNGTTTIYLPNITIREISSPGNLTHRLGMFVNGSERVSVDSQGSVGIGTTSPYAKLMVNGTTPALQVNDSAYLAVSGGRVGVGTASPDAILGVTGSANILALNVNNTLYVNTTTSSVGIGVTSAGEKLSINNNFSVAGPNSQIDIIETDQSSKRWRVEGTGGDLALTEVGVSSWVTIHNTTGYVGIGTTSPNATLNVRGGVNVTGSVNLATMEGKVGINTTLPNYLLDVYGAAHAITVRSNYTQPSYDGSDDGLILYLPFSEGSGNAVTYDRSPYGNDGLLIGMNLTGNGTSGWNSTSCVLGSCLKYSESNDYVTVNGSAVNNLAKGTASIWFNALDADGGTQSILLKLDAGVNTNFGMRLTTSGTIGTYFNNGFRTYAYTFSDNTWYNVVITWDGSQTNFYVDGVLRVATSASDSIPNNPVPNLTIGAGYAEQGGNNFNGTIDEVRFYSSALNNDEVRRLYLDSMNATLKPYVDASGRVGIGTTTPNQKLVVAGVVNFTAATIFSNVSYAWPSTAGSSSQFLQTNGAGVLSWAAAAGGGGGAGWSNTTTAVFNNTAGVSVGIGTSSPGATLQVNGSVIIQLA